MSGKKIPVLVIAIILIACFLPLTPSASASNQEETGGDKEKLTGAWEATGEGAGEPGETLRLMESQADCGENHLDGYYSGKYGSFEFCWELYEYRNEYKVYPEYDHSYDYTFKYELREGGDILVTEDEEGYVTIYEKQVLVELDVDDDDDEGYSLTSPEGCFIFSMIMIILIGILYICIRAIQLDKKGKKPQKPLPLGIIKNDLKKLKGNKEGEDNSYHSDSVNDSDDYVSDSEGVKRNKDTEGFDEENEDDEVEPKDVDWD